MSGLEFLIEQERSWLALQPEFNAGWKEGCAWLAATIEQCIDNYVAIYAAGTEQAYLAGACRDAVGFAVIYHWRCTWELCRQFEPSVSGSVVLRLLQSGKRPTVCYQTENSAKSMGGNPLRDLVLAIGAIHRTDRAIEGLLTEYRPVFDTEARRVLGRGTPIADWEELVSRLLFSRGKLRETRQSAKSVATPLLSRYRGYTSLQNWFRPVVRNFLTDAWRHLTAGRTAERHFAERHAQRLRSAGSMENLGHEHPLEPLRAPLRRAAGRLSAAEREILRWACQSDLRNFELARMLGVAPGHASRLKHRTLFLLKCVLSEDLASPSGSHCRENVNEDWRLIAAHISPLDLGEVVRVLGDIVEPEGATSLSPIMKKDHPSKPVDEDAAYSRSIGGLPTEQSDTQKSGEDLSSSEVDYPVMDQSAFYSVALDDDPNSQPEAVARHLRSILFPSRRPTIVCLDARRTSRSEKITDWLDRFAAHISDEEVNQRESDPDVPLPERVRDYVTAAFYEPLRVVIAKERVIRELTRHKKNPLDRDVLYLTSENLNGAPYTVYSNYIQQALRQASARTGVSRNPSPRGRREIGELLPESQREEWENQMNRLTGDFGGAADFES